MLLFDCLRLVRCVVVAVGLRPAFLRDVRSVERAADVVANNRAVIPVAVRGPFERLGASLSPSARAVVSIAADAADGITSLLLGAPSTSAGASSTAGLFASSGLPPRPQAEVK